MQPPRILSVLALVAACAAPSDPPAAAMAADPPAETVPPAPPTVVVPQREAIVRLEDPSAFVGRHVLVPAGVRLRTSAKPDAVTVALREPGRDDPRAYAFEVVGHEGDELIVRRAAAEHRCDPGLPELDAFDPRFYVSPRELADVLARELDTRFEDGTSVRLRPGVAVERSGPDGLADVGGLRLGVAIDPRDVGNAFVPAMAPRPDASLPTVPSGVALRYGTSGTLVAAAPLFTDAHGAPLVLSRAGAGDTQRLEVVGPCATLRVRTDETAPRELPPVSRRAALASAGVLAALTGGAESIVAAGAEVTWSDGAAAGKLARELRFDGRGTPRKRRSCFRYGDGEARFEPIELCFARKAVRFHDPMAALYGTGLHGGALWGEADGELDRLLDSSMGATVGGLRPADDAWVDRTGDGLGLGSLGTRGGGGGAADIDLGGAPK